MANARTNAKTSIKIPSIDVNVSRSTPIKRTARVSQLEGMFDVPPSKRSSKSWKVHLPLSERDWNIGLVLGPSGAGKSAIINEAFPGRVVEGYHWSDDSSVADDFPKGMSIKDIADVLSSVGFSSPPSWLKPYTALSTGERFRVTLARALAENDEMVVLDEFTSVIDRTVAQIGSAAVSKAVRRTNKKFIAATCHFDILEWLQPDWVYKPHLLEFEWRRLRRFPEVVLEVRRVHRSAWQLFKEHHYLSRDIANSAQCFCAFVDGEPAAFAAVMSFPHHTSPGWRGHRTVTLPDFQGVGIGNTLSEYVAGLYRATGKPYRSTTAHPSMIAHRARSKKWRMIQAPRRNAKVGPRGDKKMLRTISTKRRVASFEYVGPALVEDAKKFGVVKPKNTLDLVGKAKG